MANLAIANEETPSMTDEVDDDMAGFGRVSTQFYLGHEGEGLPRGNPKRTASVARSTTEDRLVGTR